MKTLHRISILAIIVTGLLATILAAKSTSSNSLETETAETSYKASTLHSSIPPRIIDGAQDNEGDVDFTKKNDDNLLDGRVDLQTTDLSEDATLNYIGLSPNVVLGDITGFSVNLESTEYSLEDFGFLQGDKITHIANSRIKTSDDVLRLVKENLIYGSVIVTVNRNNEILDLEIEL